mgnify:CR=1 FL=1
MTDLNKLVSQIREFSEKRDWGQYHKPKDLSLKLMEEVGELVEHFEWKTDQEIKQYLADPDNLDETAAEAIDVLIVILTILDYCLDVDIDRAFQAKLKKNADKYPVKPAK